MNAPVISPAVSVGAAGWSATIDACHCLLAIVVYRHANQWAFDLPND